MRRGIRIAAAMALAAGAMAAGPTWAAGGDGAARASSYVNRDTGLATENSDVDVPSNCGRPDASDTQVLSAAGTTSRNVHNDACLFTSGAPSTATQSDVDGPATFESFGVGTINACPDPDATGPKTAVTHDHNGDGRVEHCHQSGYQNRAGAGGNLEYHARLNNTTQAGPQRVLFCADGDGDGCLDESVRSQIAVGWVAPTPAP